MPTAYIKKVAKKLNKSVADVEKVWNQAKAIASKDYSGDKVYPVATSIFQKMMKINEAVSFVDYTNHLNELKKEDSSNSQNKD